MSRSGSSKSRMHPWPTSASRSRFSSSSSPPSSVPWYIPWRLWTRCLEGLVTCCTRCVEGLVTCCREVVDAVPRRVLALYSFIWCPQFGEPGLGPASRSRSSFSSSLPSSVPWYSSHLIYGSVLRTRCGAKPAYIRQSRPDYGFGIPELQLCFCLFGLTG